MILCDLFSFCGGLLMTSMVPAKLKNSFANYVLALSMVAGTAAMALPQHAEAAGRTIYRGQHGLLVQACRIVRPRYQWVRFDAYLPVNRRVRMEGGLFVRQAPFFFPFWWHKTHVSYKRTIRGGMFKHYRGVLPQAVDSRLVMIPVVDYKWRIPTRAGVRYRHVTGRMRAFGVGSLPRCRR